MTRSPFEDALVGAVQLLRGLPHEPVAADAARERWRAFAAAHPAVGTELLVDRAPGAIRADFDLYLAHPEGGTVALSYRDDGARPWFVDYSEHWAANYVLHAGATDVSVQEALFAIQYLGETHPDIVRGLVRDALLVDAIAAAPEHWKTDALNVTADELQDAADRFRQRHGLESAADTMAWLDRMGWSVHQFRSVLSNGLEVRKMEEMLVGPQVEPHFEAHRADFDVVRCFRVTCGDAATAALLVASAGAGLLSATQSLLAAPDAEADRVAELTGELTASRAYELGAAAATEPGTIVGPVLERQSHVVVQVLTRAPATTLDPATRHAVRERLMRKWVDKRIREVGVRWRWG